MNEKRLYVAHRLKRTGALGPGQRYALWLQGCKKSCAGCVFPEGRSLDSGGYFISVTDLATEILSQKDIRGITVSGGEPFLQAEGLAALLRNVKAGADLDIMIYSGYTLAELRAKQSEAINEILSLADLLIDGEYREAENNNSLYRGSDNQTIHFLSSRFKAWEEQIINHKGRPLEFVRENSELFMVGLPPKNFKQAFFKKAEILGK